MKKRDDSEHTTLFGYILEDGAPPTCSRFPGDESQKSRRSIISVEKSCIQTDVHDEEWNNLPITREGNFTGNNRDTSGSAFLRPISRVASASAGPSHSTSSCCIEPDMISRRITQEDETSPPQYSPGTTLPSVPKTTRPRLSAHLPTRSPFEDLSGEFGNLPPIPAFTPMDAIKFPVGSYDIVLILDTREVESKTSRDKFAEALEMKGVKVETRALKLGDMCWIARRRDGIGGEEDECVLDYVVERKRLDDLCSSIKDGRYNEQCVSDQTQ